jgi:2-phosphoglycerate kinase
VFDYIQAHLQEHNLVPQHNAITMSVSGFSKILEIGFHKNEFSKPDVMKDFLVASMLMQSKINVIVLLAGTSGTGKSTLASLVGARFGI